MTPEQFIAMCAELKALGAAEVRFGEFYCKFTYNQAVVVAKPAAAGANHSVPVDEDTDPADRKRAQRLRELGRGR